MDADSQGRVEGGCRRGGNVARAARAVVTRRPPNRSCVACRTVRAKRELLRIVRSPLGDVSIDRTGKAAGRGAYVCRAAECIDNAIKKGALNRALHTSVPANLRDLLAAELADRTLTMTEGGARGQE